MKSTVTKHLLLAFILPLSITYLNAQCPNIVGQGQHQVKPGDNLYRLSKAYQVSLTDLCKWNQLTISDTLKVCQALIVKDPEIVSESEIIAPVVYSAKTPTPPVAATDAAAHKTTVKSNVQAGGRHTVQDGETVASIAELYGYTEWRFRQINAMSANDRLTPGSIVISSDCTCPPLMSHQIDANPIGASITTKAETEKSAIDALTFPAATPPVTHNNTQSSAMKQSERDMVAEINLVRSNPAAYVQYIEKYQKESMIPASAQTAAELIAELRSLRKLSTLAPSDCLFDAAKWHAETQRPKGDIDHQGTDGSWPWERVTRYCSAMADGNENIVGGPSAVRNSVIVLLLDEGIPSRGHRKNLLNPEWKYVACYGAGTVGTMPNCYVQMFGK